ncbi:hypothetical protein IMCC9480_791 [Oxalobacteraceae bacterium IMCC9480]|nr:hypothetical protein IMCC9480_791 [Oxalobacteraceae bacterium IMCC9480]
MDALIASASALEPDAGQQLAFLRQLQRLFQEGDFTSTYKYALLLALAELAIECDGHAGAELVLPMERIAGKFAEFYWLQSLPYSADATGNHGVLFQNSGLQVAVIGHLTALRDLGISTLSQARQHPHWPRTLEAIASRVRDMPVPRLQSLSGSSVVFLFDPATVGKTLTLLPGVAFHLRRFQGFIQQLVRAGWVNYIRSNNKNASLVGQGADLEAFLFMTPRAALAKVEQLLSPLQDRRCFFCQQGLHEKGDVDHFIPWSRYPRDTALNFVLAHKKCNTDKRDLLAGGAHLDRWLERNAREGATIAGQLQQAGFVSEPGVEMMVASWAYREGVSAGVQVWQGCGNTTRISPDVMQSFG